MRGVREEEPAALDVEEAAERGVGQRLRLVRQRGSPVASYSSSRPASERRVVVEERAARPRRRPAPRRACAGGPSRGSTAVADRARRVHVGGPAGRGAPTSASAPIARPFVCGEDARVGSRDSTKHPSASPADRRRRAASRAASAPYAARPATSCARAHIAIASACSATGGRRPRPTDARAAGRARWSRASAAPGRRVRRYSASSNRIAACGGAPSARPSSGDATVARVAASTVAASNGRRAADGCCADRIASSAAVARGSSPDRAARYAARAPSANRPNAAAVERSGATRERPPVGRERHQQGQAVAAAQLADREPELVHEIGAQDAVRLRRPTKSRAIRSATAGSTGQTAARFRGRPVRDEGEHGSVRLAARPQRPPPTTRERAPRRRRRRPPGRAPAPGTTSRRETFDEASAMGTGIQIVQSARCEPWKHAVKGCPGRA